MDRFHGPRSNAASGKRAGHDSPPTYRHAPEVDSNWVKMASVRVENGIIPSIGGSIRKKAGRKNANLIRRTAGSDWPPGFSRSRSVRTRDRDPGENVGQRLVLRLFSDSRAVRFSET
jgi:hypothetical protein